MKVSIEEQLEIDRHQTRETIIEQTREAIKRIGPMVQAGVLKVASKYDVMTDEQLKLMADMRDEFEEFEKNFDRVEGDTDQLSEGEQRLFWIWVRDLGRSKKETPAVKAGAQEAI